MADTTEVIYADRDRCCDDRNRGYGAGWGAVGGALVGGGFGAIFNRWLSDYIGQGDLDEIDFKRYI